MIRALIAVVAVLVATAVPAAAHSFYPNYINEFGTGCCDNDCFPLADDDVTETAGGYAVKSLGVTVPWGLMKASPDGRYHICPVKCPPGILSPVCARGWRCFWGPVPSY